MSDGLKVELGGGTKPRGGDWLNVDREAVPGVFAVRDFARLVEADGPVRRGGYRWPGVDGDGAECWLPFADDSVSEVYSSHCLEHVAPYHGLLHEIARVCRVGATVEVRVPHWLQSMAMCQGHRQTISPTQVRHWVKDFIADWWKGCTKRLALQRTEYVPGEAFAEARPLFPQLTDEQVMRLVPDCCHEIRFLFAVVANESD